MTFHRPLTDADLAANARRPAAELLRHPISLRLSAGSVDLLADIVARRSDAVSDAERAWLCQAMIAAIDARGRPRPGGAAMSGTTYGVGLGTAEGRPALNGTAPNWFAAKQPETAPAVRAPHPDGAADQVGTKSDRVSHVQLHCVVATEAAQIPTYTAPRPSARGAAMATDDEQQEGQQKPQRGTVLCNRRVDGPYTVLPNAIVQGSRSDARAVPAAGLHRFIAGGLEPADRSGRQEVPHGARPGLRCPL